MFSTNSKTVAIFTALIVMGAYLHISVGMQNLSIQHLIDAIFNYNEDNFDHYVVNELRLPRVLITIFVGFCLGISTPIVQGTLNNKLISTGILGMNTGASFAVVVGLAFFNIASLAYIPIFAFFGALSTFIAVYLIAKGINKSIDFSIRLLLCGAMIKALLSSMITLALLLDEQTLDDIRLWLSGDISSDDISSLYMLMPIMAVAVVFAIYLRKDVQVLSTGKDIAKTLGMNLNVVLLIILFTVVLLSAISVSIVGPIGFVGFTASHIGRIFVGANYKKLILLSGFIGSTLLIFADIIARVIILPFELSTGIVTALFGSPIFMALLIFYKRSKHA